MSSYFKSIADYYLDIPFENLKESAVEKIKLSILDFLGVAYLAGKNSGQSKAMKFIESISSNDGRCTVFGGDKKLDCAAAIFANGFLAARYELDDATSIGASVHPAASVIPAALAVAEDKKSSGRDIIKSVIFGYDVCNRMGLLSTKKMQELGLHGPGFHSALGAVSGGGLLLSLDSERLLNAFSLALSLAPVCPFVNFIDGADAKDIYGGYGGYLGMLSLRMAECGLTASNRILDGPMSLKSIFSGNTGKEVLPGEHYYSEDVVFKDYSACLSAHAVLTAVERLQEKHCFSGEDVDSAEIIAYPFAYDLSEMTGELNEISARLNIPYTAAVMLYEGELSPSGFTKESLQDKRYLDLAKRISIKCGDQFGRGPFGKRGCEITIRLKNGEMISKRVDSAKWGKNDPPSEEEIKGKFKKLTLGHLSEKSQEEIIDYIMTLEDKKDITTLIEILK